MLGGVEFRALELAKRQYKKVPENLTNGAPLCIINMQRWGGYLPHGETYHTHKGTPHTTTHSPADAFISYVLKQWQTHKTQEKRSRLSSAHL